MKENEWNLQRQIESRASNWWCACDNHYSKSLLFFSMFQCVDLMAIRRCRRFFFSSFRSILSFALRTSSKTAPVSSDDPSTDENPFVFFFFRFLLISVSFATSDEWPKYRHKIIVNKRFLTFVRTKKGEKYYKNWRKFFVVAVVLFERPKISHLLMPSISLLAKMMASKNASNKTESNQVKSVIRSIPTVYNLIKCSMNAHSPNSNAQQFTVLL